MTRLPQLEAQLVAAAGRGRPRSRRPLLLAAAALAVAACVAAALLLVPGPAPERPASVPQTVPASTLVKARALSQGRLAQDARIPVAEVPAAAKRMMAPVPYPPGVRDRFDYRRRASQLTSGLELQRLVEYHAYCAWVSYWVGGADRAAATAVIDQTQHWPALRQHGRATYWHKKIATAARGGDVATMRREAGVNCS